MSPTTDPRPTLLVFTLGATWEARRRRLLPGWSRGIEERLHRACLENALAAGRGAGCRLEVSSPRRLETGVDVERREQRGKGFAARLRQATSAAFAASPGPVVAVGSDVPDLGAGHVRRALDLVAADPDRVVIGPSPDGGFYLLAAARPLDEALAATRFCRRDTLATLRRALAAAGREVVLLEPLADLDQTRDLERWLAAGELGASWRRLAVLILGLFARLRLGTADRVPGRRRAAARGVPPLRAPPVAT